MLAVLIAIGLACAACGGRGTGFKPGDSAAPGPAGLVAPGELLPEIKPREASYIESDLQKDGADFDGGLPNNLVATDSTIGVFSPNFIPEDSLTSAAFATYDFNISGYDRNPQVRYEWDSPPGPGHLWLGLADWDADTWQWFKPNPSAPLNLTDIAPYIRGDGELLAVVLVTGTQEDRLLSLRIGSQRPQISWTVDSPSGFVPFTCSIDASASSDPDGTIAKFEWDLDGNGSYEVSGTDSTQEVNVSDTGAFDVKLRVTDNDGVSAERQLTVRGFSEWVHSWGGGGQEEFKDCAYDGDEHLYFAGYTSSFGSGIFDILLVKYDLAGNLVWAHTWGTASGEAGWATAVDSEGNILVVGKLLNNLGLVKFSPDGQTIWAKVYSYSSYSLEPRDIAVRGTDIYLCGFATDISMPTSNFGFLARVNAAGELQWLTGQSGAALTSLQLYSSFIGDPLIHAVGSYGSDMLYLRADTDGGLIRADRWGGSGNSVTGVDLSVSGVGLSPTIWLVGRVSYSGETSPNTALVEYQLGTTPANRTWDGGNQDLCQGLMRGTDGQLYVCTLSAELSAHKDSVLLGYNDAVVLEHSSRLTNGAADTIISRPHLLDGTAIAVGGACGAADGSSWLPCSGTSSSLTWQWTEFAGELFPYPVSEGAAPGDLGTPSSAVLDSGGGGPADALAVVREAP